MRGDGFPLGHASLLLAVRRRLRFARGRTRLFLRRLGGQAAGRRLAGFETWPAWAFYLPVGAYVVWRGLAHGSVSLPAVVNPPANRDGVLNVSKSGLFAAMSPEARQWLPPYAVLERSAEASPEATLAAALEAAERAGIDFPLVAKPDRGGRAAGVRRIADAGSLGRYLAAFPAGHRLILQKVIPHPHEAGIMYLRHPSGGAGRIVSMALKEAPQATGDGVTPLGELIDRHPRARHHRLHARREHAGRLERVPAPGERVELVFARNHCRGAIFRDASHLVTPALERRIDAIVGTIPDFQFGRVDLRFASLGELRRGENFLLIELNGAVSEPIHAWDPANGPQQAWRAYFEQIDRLYAVGAASRARGHADPGLLPLLAGWLKQRRVTRAYPGEP